VVSLTSASSVAGSGKATRRPRHSPHLGETLYHARPIATLLGLAFRLYDPQRLLGGEEEVGITLALIPTDTLGVHIGRRHLPLNAAFMNGPNWGKDVFVPMDYVIGGVQYVGQGWRMLMNCLAAGRSISLPANGVGIAKLCARTVGAYARVRTQFKVSIGKFEGVEEAIARIGGNTTSWMRPGS